jgi:hypothetical protein
VITPRLKIRDDAVIPRERIDSVKERGEPRSRSTGWERTKVPAPLRRSISPSAATNCTA